MTTVFVKDDLRASVEGATGGQCTVLYSQQGMPSYFHVFPKFNIEDIDPDFGSGPHPAFIVNGQEVSQLFVGMFQGVVRNGELLSLPQLMPNTGMTLESAATAARTCGAGYHVMTNAEWAAIAMWCMVNEFLPSGNGDWGRNYSAPFETGVRADGLNPGDDGGNGITLTGSGPISWRHNNKSTGIADLVGNVREWVSGVRLVDGELQIFENNDAASHQGAFGSAGAWKAISFATGALVSPGTTGTVKLDSNYAVSGAPPQNVGPFAWANTITNHLGPNGSTSELDFNGMEFADIPDAGPALLKTLGLVPVASGFFLGNAYMRNYGTRYFSRGERYLAHAPVGVFGMAAVDVIANTHYYTGARVVKY